MHPVGLLEPERSVITDEDELMGGHFVSCCEGCEPDDDVASFASTTRSRSNSIHFTPVGLVRSALGARQYLAEGLTERFFSKLHRAVGVRHVGAEAAGNISAPGPSRDGAQDSLGIAGVQIPLN